MFLNYLYLDFTLLQSIISKTLKTKNAYIVVLLIFKRRSTLLIGISNGINCVNQTSFIKLVLHEITMVFYLSEVPTF